MLKATDTASDQTLVASIRDRRLRFQVGWELLSSEVAADEKLSAFASYERRPTTRCKMQGQVPRPIDLNPRGGRLRQYHCSRKQ